VDVGRNDLKFIPTHLSGFEGVALGFKGPDHFEAMLRRD